MTKTSGGRDQQTASLGGGSFQFLAACPVGTPERLMHGSREKSAGLVVTRALFAIVVLGVSPSLACALPPVAAERTAVGPTNRRTFVKQIEAVQAELLARQKRHSAELDSISQEFSDLGLTKDVNRCRELAAPMETALFRVTTLPTAVQPEIPAELPEKERALRLSFRKCEIDYAADLCRIAKKAIKAGYPSYAFQLVQEIVRHDPDHAYARQILGYKRRSKEWVTPYAADQLDKGFVWDETFGWQKKADLPRLKAGKRWNGIRWISADQEAEFRRDFSHAWTVRTDHYLIKTNHSLERGVEIAKALEQYHDFFMQTFAAFFSTDEQMRKLFANPKANLNQQAHHPYKVYYFRTREEYLNRLKARVPQIEWTNGLYYTSDRVAYFYFDPKATNQDTLFHEATHQLFYENNRLDRMIAVHENFWIVEGIACYMESYHAENGQFVVGDPNHIRIRAARHRSVVDHYYVPMAQFAAMGMQQFQNSPNITKNYSQASGLAHFFMHYDGGRYRDALIEHLTEIYASTPRHQATVKSLAELTGVSFPELDQQYAEYMRLLPIGATQASADGH